MWYVCACGMCVGTICENVVYVYVCMCVGGEMCEHVECVHVYMCGVPVSM